VLVLAGGRSLDAQGDSCQSAESIGLGEVTGSTEDASSDGSGSCGRSRSSPDQWYEFVADEAGSYTFTTCGSSYDTVLSLHSGCSQDDELECNDDSCELQSTVQHNLGIEEVVLIRVSGYDRASGSYTLRVSFDPGDPGGGGCDESIDLVVGERVNGSTSSASNEGSANCGNSRDSRDRFYRFTATESCLLRASTCGSDFDTVLSIHSGCPPARDNEIECNDDACGLQSVVSATVEAGQVYWIRVAGYGNSSGGYTLAVECGDIPEPGDGADATIASTNGIQQVGREGSVVALSMSSTICNVGDEPLDWRANPDPRHPFLVFNMFRLVDDRLEQIGQSWAKHGFAASQSSGVCGLPCNSDRGGDLGSGCADVYGVGTNAAQSSYGPRHEINPWTGVFTYAGSHISGGRGGHDDVEHLLAIDDADLDPQRNPDTRYFVELYVVAHDDTEHTNSTGWQEVDITGGRPGGTWRLDFRQVVSDVGPIHDAWEGTTDVVLPQGELTDDGRCYLAAKAIDMGDGTHRYTYALYNLDMDRGVQSFSVNVPVGVAVSNVGSHASASDQDGYSNAAWISSRDGSTLRWATETFAENPAANPLRWGTLHTFWFDAAAAPVDREVRISEYNPGGAGEHVGTSVGPAGTSTAVSFKRSDVDGNGVTEMSDAMTILSYLFLGGASLPCLDAADVNDSNSLDVSDAVGVLLWLYSGGLVPVDPGPQTCGPDPTASDFPRCEYPSDSC